MCKSAKCSRKIRHAVVQAAEHHGHVEPAAKVLSIRQVEDSRLASNELPISGASLLRYVDAANPCLRKFFGYPKRVVAAASRDVHDILAIEVETVEHHIVDKLLAERHRFGIEIVCFILVVNRLEMGLLLENFSPHRIGLQSEWLRRLAHLRRWL